MMSEVTGNTQSVDVHRNMHEQDKCVLGKSLDNFILTTLLLILSPSIPKMTKKGATES